MPIARLYPSGVVSNEVFTYNSLTGLVTNPTGWNGAFANPSENIPQVGGLFKFPFASLPANATRINSLSVGTLAYVGEDSWYMAFSHVYNPGIESIGYNNIGPGNNIGGYDISSGRPPPTSILLTTKNPSGATSSVPASTWRSNNVVCHVLFRTVGSYYGYPWEPCSLYWDQLWIDVNYEATNSQPGGSLLFMGENF